MADVIERDNAAYKPRYGEWAGRPNGAAPDYDRCCFEVFSNERGVIHHQCNKKRGYGPGSAYCKTHDPDAVKARQAEAHAKYTKQYNAQRYGLYGREFFNALEQIANGHNDARGLAAEVIAKFKAGERT